MNTWKKRRQSCGSCAKSRIASASWLACRRKKAAVLSAAKSAKARARRLPLKSRSRRSRIKVRNLLHHVALLGVGEFREHRQGQYLTSRLFTLRQVALP